MMCRLLRSKLEVRGYRLQAIGAPDRPGSPQGGRPAQLSCAPSTLRAFAFAICALLCTGAFCQTEPAVTVRPAEPSGPEVLLLVDGKLVEIESAHVQRGMQVMVWLRDLERLGWGTIEASSPDRVTFTGKGVTLSFSKGQGVALINSLAVNLPINVYLREDKLMVPLSFVAKALGFDYQCVERPVATILTEPPKPVARTTNTLQGTVTYNGSGVGGVIVRAVDADYTVVKNAAAKTDAKGNYRIEGLPDGTYRAYVYAGDNPAYFNRDSEPIELKGGSVLQVRPISLGRVLLPTKPKPGSELEPAQKGMIGFSWTACEGAAAYKLTITRKGGQKAIYEVSTPQPSVSVPASLFALGTTYEAQVSAANASGDYVGGTAGPGGTPWTFTAKR